jgi:photosystem II stability/assembly factor-like uncharacterized protein
MKQMYILIVALLIMVSASQSGAQTWNQLTAQTLPTFSTAFFLNTTTGWFVGPKGLMRTTADGGKTWTDITTNIFEDLKSVFFLNTTTGFIGSTTKIYKTTNSGSTWTSIDVTGAISSSGYIYAIFFADTQKGWVISSSSTAGKIIQTVDAGATWTVGADNPTGDLEAMDFYNATLGVVVGGGVGKCDLWYTKNGTTWTKAAAPTFPAGYTRTDVKGVIMVNENIVYADGWGSLVGPQASIQLKSTDGGASWTYLTQLDANKTYDNMYELYFKDVNNGLAVGGYVVRTSDGGTTWTPINFPSGSSLKNIYGSGDNVIVSAIDGTFLSSTDFGTTWKFLTNVPSFTINSIFAVNHNTIYAGGSNGAILKTIDGGKNWIGSYQRVNNSSQNIQGLYFVNENVGYSANSYRMIAKTVNGGASWTSVLDATTSATQILYGVHFINENLGFVVGKDGSNIDIIYKTTNGGGTWTEQKNIAATNLRGIAFFDAQKGITVGEKLKALYTLDGGTTWTASTFNGVPTASASATLREVTFINATTAIAVGDKLILKTTDGGASWNNITIADLTHSLTGVASQGNTIWAVGYKSAAPKSVAVYQSTDAGLAWTNQGIASSFDVETTVYDVAIIPSGSVFVGATKSIIYSNALISDVEENGNELPTVFQLNQNYPNPFNPITKINYTLNQTGIVRLHVYDILGRLVKTLVNEYQEAGTHVIQFDGHDLSSGTYVYTLFLNNSILSKKMLLIK